MGQVLFKSDYIDVAAEQRDTFWLQYSNKETFAGIDYSASQVFGIRIATKFFKERAPETNESEDITDGGVVKLSGLVKFQRQLEMDAAPYYMHNKLKLILQHNTIFLDGSYWLKEEPYEYIDLGGNNFPEFPLKLAKTWLTRMTLDFFSNVYGELTAVTPPDGIFADEFAAEFE